MSEGLKGVVGVGPGGGSMAAWLFLCCSRGSIFGDLSCDEMDVSRV
jgi:hypothetical protein